MRQISRVILITAGAVSLAALTGFAQPAPQTAPGAADQTRRARPGWRMDQALNLTDTQREDIRKLREEHRASIREDAQKLREANRQLHAALFADSLDQAKIESLKTEVAQLSQQLQMRRFEQQERLSRILTPEQRKLMLEHRQFMRGFRQGRAADTGGNRGRGFRQFRQWE